MHFEPELSGENLSDQASDNRGWNENEEADRHENGMCIPQVANSRCPVARSIFTVISMHWIIIDCGCIIVGHNKDSIQQEK